MSTEVTSATIQEHADGLAETLQALGLTAGAADDIRKKVGRVSPDNFPALVGALELAVMNMRKDVPGHAAVGSIERFFTEVGNGLVQAQNRMDSESLRYNANRPEVSLPSLFRIPKVSAELKFAMTHTEEAGFNFLVYGERESETRTQQNSISFDIISAPPPAELFDDIDLGVRFVTRPSERAFLKREIIDALADAPGDNVQTIGSKLLEQFDETLLIHGSGGALVAVRPLPGALDGQNPAIRHAAFGAFRRGAQGALTVEEGSLVETVASDKGNPRLKVLLPFLQDISKNMATQLAALRGGLGGANE